ncbi:MAG: DUF1273 domain-containing protein [Ruminococcaceae bacterium]|nr:DUF1273 domain-containing protein [Oscillospiraceae bacterium]
MYSPEKASTCCFTGHRVITGEAKITVFNRLCDTVRELYLKGITTFVSGGALGFDTLAAFAVLHLKREFSGMKLVLALPCRDQDSRWSRADRETYRKILDAADEVICLNESYCTGCMHQRNRLMVNLSSVCVAYCTKASGGTAYTVNLAKSEGLRVLNLAASPHNQK